MAWLKNKIVLITRSSEQSPTEISLLEKEGARVIAFPTIQIQPVENTSLIDEAIYNLSQYDYLIFSSVNGVKYFSVRLDNLDAGIPVKVKVVCVGSKTQKYAESLNLKVNIVPDDFSASGMLTELASYKLENKKCLLPTSEIARDELTNGLRKMGAIVNVITVYNSVLPGIKDVEEQLQIVKNNKPDAFIFSSPSSFVNLVKLLNIINPGEYFSGCIVAAIGRTTHDEIINHKTHVDIVPDESTIYACVESLRQYEIVYNTEK
jgi:uroporphyrinogen-III synthase